MQRPPPGVRLVVEAVCIMKGIKPKKVAGEKVREINEVQTNFNFLLCISFIRNRFTFQTGTPSARENPKGSVRLRIRQNGEFVPLRKLVLCMHIILTVVFK